LFERVVGCTALPRSKAISSLRRLSARFASKVGQRVTGAWKADFIYEPHSIVSGDYCDVIVQDDELYFVMATCRAKGMAASLLMSSLHACFITLVPLTSCRSARSCQGQIILWLRIRHA
jgi:hypothetical protein